MASSNHRPDLRAPVLVLLERLMPAVRDGGSLPLVDLVVAVTGDRMKPEVRPKLDARGDLVLVRGADAASFSNDGPETSIALKRFDLRIPARLRGDARVIGAGVRLAFDPKATLAASKLLLAARFASIEVSPDRIHVRMEQSVLDQVYELN